MSLRPSSLPMLAECPCFESQGSDCADEGTQRHLYLRQLLTSAPDKVSIEAFSDEDIEGCQWAADYIKLHAPISDYPLVCEHHVNPTGDDFEPLFPNGGTLDFACGPNIWDFKWRRRDYYPQLAAYALGWMQENGFESCHATALFGQSKTAEKFFFCQSDAQFAISDVTRKLTPDAKPTPCEYCGWCARKMTCPALTSKASTIAGAREDVDQVTLSSFNEWLASGAHTSAIEDPVMMATVLTIARQLGHFIDGAEYRAKQMADKEGRTLPGYELKTKAGKQYCQDAAAAFPLAGLPQELFLPCCELKLNTSKQYPDKKGIIDTYAAVHGMKKAAAKKELMRKLESVIKKTKDSVTLKSVKDTTENEEE